MASVALNGESVMNRGFSWHLPLTRRWQRFCLAAFFVLAPAVSTVEAGAQAYDPLGHALTSAGNIANQDAPIPVQCYIQTIGKAGVSNSCWTCHTRPAGENRRNDEDLQYNYTFSETARTNHWHNLYVDLPSRTVQISDAEVLQYIREDNYGPLQLALRKRREYQGYVPDLDFSQMFDTEGFARDGSGWRAFRYKPFPAPLLWPTNGNTQDVMIRLPAKFRADLAGKASREVYKRNFAILEAAIAVGPDTREDQRKRKKREKSLSDRLPVYYVGGAASVAVHRYLFPKGTEFLHTVRYLDPDAEGLLSTRMKEVRYARKVAWLDTWARNLAYEVELQEKFEGLAPMFSFSGSPEVGLRNSFGWQYQAFIEDEAGRLRLQSHEELLFCMGCHSSLGITVDQTFSFARKIPKEKGWRHQSLQGMADVPQSGHDVPEILTYLRRAKNGGGLGANKEFMQRFFRNGILDETKVRRASPGGDRDITFLLVPSRDRAMRLNKAAMELVRRQRFTGGRELVLTPFLNLYSEVKRSTTGLLENEKVFSDGRLWLDWSE